MTGFATKLFRHEGVGSVARSLVEKIGESISVADFGAVGDGVADDTAAIQAAINAAMASSGVVVFNGPATYKISSPLTVKVTRDLLEETVGAAQFSDNCAAFMVGYGSPVIKASSAMAHMMTFIFDVADSDIAPFFSEVRGLAFDGNNLAVIGIHSNYALGCVYDHNRFFGLDVGISYTGYGVFKVLNNTFKCDIGISAVGGGGDSLIEGNDFYVAENSTSSISLGYYSGNSRIISNVFTNEGGYTGCYAIKLDGRTAAISEEIRNIVISDNEFCGYTSGIFAVGKSSGVQNVYDCIIRGNHTLPYGGSNPGKLLDATDCSGFTITENKFNSISFSDATEAHGCNLTRCIDFQVHNNFFENYSNNALRMTDCIRATVSDNTFYNCGKLGAGYEVVRVSGASSSRNYLLHNRFYQSSDSFAENGIIETAGANATFALGNVFLGVNRPYTKIGAASVMKREESGSSSPVAEYWNQGDVIWNSSVAAGGSPGWVCVLAGAPGTWKQLPAVGA